MDAIVALLQSIADVLKLWLTLKVHSEAYDLAKTISNDEITAQNNLDAAIAAGNLDLANRLREQSANLVGVASAAKSAALSTANPPA